MIEDTT